MEYRMNTWKVASRLYLIVALCVAVMLMLAAASWLVSTRLGELQDEGVEKARHAAEMRQASSLGAQLYRVVADTYINREFDAVQKRWKEVSDRADQALGRAHELAGSDGTRQSVAAARAAMSEIQKLYVESYLPLARRDAPREEIGPVDDRVDKLIDSYEENLLRLADTLAADADRADKDYDRTVGQTRLMTLLLVFGGGLVLTLAALAVSRSVTRQLGMEPQEAMDLARRIAEGDLSHVDAAASARSDSLAGALTAMVGKLEQLVLQVRAGAEGVASASTQISQGSLDLSTRTEHQASALQQTAATMEELGTAVRQSADSAAHADQLAQGASGVAAEGGEVVREVVQTMAGITESSMRIAEIISVIDGIAFQTNILALNAAVEAARAGEQGRGFAVVASEVRSLAQRSAAAAREIKSLIGASVERVQAGRDLVDKAGAKMEEIVVSIRKVSGIVGEISHATEQQSQGVRQVGQAVTQMDGATQQNAALVEESTAAAESLKQQAAELVQAFSAFRLSRA
jgi:methyl-accepting chemotaxis protein